MTSTLNGPRRATTIILSVQHKVPRPLSRRYDVLRNTTSHCRSYATRSPEEKESTAVIVESSIPEELINGPIESLPPPLNLPERVKGQSAAYHLYNVGRAYGKFYWAGVKATWANHKKARSLKDTIVQKNRERGLPKMPRPLLAHIEFYFNTSSDLNRRDFQRLMREQYDFKKLPPFALMVALFGEWLPLVVPFVPTAVPRTCRIPSQIEGMRKALEERRKRSFREGLKVPQAPRTGDDPLPTRFEGGKTVLPRLYRAMVISQDIVKQGKPQMMHLSRTLGIGGKLLDSLNMTHPLFPVRLMRHLGYLHIDDELLLQDWVMSHLTLTEEETRIACEERGIDVVGRSESDLKSDLGKWLEGRKRDDGSGQEILRMLFTRPNTWE